MRSAAFAIFLISATAMYPQSNQPDAMMARWEKAQTYASEGFEPISCFAGQVKVEGKRLSRQPFSLFAPDQDQKCCGTLLKSARTDQHGHFLVEPLPEGRYFAKFKSKGSDDLVSFAVVQSYERCGGTQTIPVKTVKNTSLIATANRAPRLYWRNIAISLIDGVVSAIFC